MGADEVIWLWLQKYAAFVTNAHRRRADQRTSWEAAFGAGYKGELLPFGETAHFKVPTSHQREIADGGSSRRATPRWSRASGSASTRAPTTTST